MPRKRKPVVLTAPLAGWPECLFDETPAVVRVELSRAEGVFGPLCWECRCSEEFDGDKWDWLELAQAERILNDQRGAGDA